MRKEYRRVKAYRVYEDVLFRFAGIVIIGAVLWRVLDWLL